jgi:predicted metalloprotease with PDZ domain
MLSPADLSRIATELRGLPILGCLEGSPAAHAGVRYGDIILSVNGIPTPSWADFFEARRSTKGRMTVRLFRLGSELEIAMELSPTANSPRSVLEELVRRDLAPVKSPSAEDKAFAPPRRPHELS